LRRPIPMWAYLTGWSLLVIALLVSENRANRSERLMGDAINRANRSERLMGDAIKSARDATQLAEWWRGRADALGDKCIVSLPSSCCGNYAPILVVVVCFYGCWVFIAWRAMGWLRAWRDRRRWPRSAERPGDLSRRGARLK
jgi:hypothetical protein